MDISAIISKNLSDWMQSSPDLDTLKKVAAKAQVGFGTAQRVRDGSGNVTVQNLTLIAKAFGRHPADLITDSSTTTSASVETRGSHRKVTLTAQEPTQAEREARQIAELAEKLSSSERRHIIAIIKAMAGASQNTSQDYQQQAIEASQSGWIDISDPQKQNNRLTK